MSAPTYRALFHTFLRIGLLSFGGPAAQISVMHRTLVEEKGWMSEQEYLDALAFCMLLPGPEAMQVATYGGWKVRGLWGGLIAGGLFVIPGAIFMAILAALYVTYAELPLVEAAFVGIKAAVLVIVFQALLKLSGRTLTKALSWALAIMSFCAITILNLPFPLIVLLAGLIGFLFLKASALARTPHVQTSWRACFATLILGTLLWLAPLLVLPAGVLSDLGFFFSKLAAFSFGGAYAGLSYMAQDLAQALGVVSQAQMVDGLGLAETTPGPLILVTEFMAYVAADAGGHWGIWGALIALWAIFVPCFILIFAFAPFVAQICAQPRLRGALSGISAAVVGVIAYLSLWFALSVFFSEATPQSWGLFHWLSVDISTFDWRAGLLLIVAAVLTWRKFALPWILLLSALGGLALSYAV